MIPARWWRRRRNAGGVVEPMARIALDELAHSYLAQPSAPDDYALRRMDHVWEDGGAYALLGPSGCGKTTLLNIISGLVRPSEGRVLFDGVDVTDFDSKQRNIAQVFQFPVVYDTMSVYNNLAFPLRNRGIGETQVDKRVLEVADMLELTPVLRQRAVGLTADAKQTISLGRGLVRSDVAAILFDEPLTVIDPHLKWKLRRKLKQIHERYKLTLVYVTHDQNEALTFADKVVIMDRGEVLQLGTPQELFETPAHVMVGNFIGSPGMNFLPCTLDGADALVAGHRLRLAEGVAAAVPAGATKLQVGVRPEFLDLAATSETGSVPVELEITSDLGNFLMARVALGPHRLNIRLPEDVALPGGEAHMRLDPRHTRLYADGRLVRAAGGGA